MNITEDPEFRTMMRFLNPRFHLVAAKSIRLNLVSLENDIDQNVRQKFSQVPVVSVTTNCRTDEQTTSYASLTVHCQTDAWKMEAEVLACSRIAGRYTAENLSRFLIAALKRYDILGKCLSILVENATNAVPYVRISAEQFGVL